MTAEEVKNRLDELIKDRESFMVGNYDKDIYDRDKEALEFAVKAIEKQIPKKFVGRLSTLDINCPCCNSEDIYDIPNRRIVKQNYCPNCGQALDWSGENE